MSYDMSKVVFEHVLKRKNIFSGLFAGLFFMAFFSGLCINKQKLMIKTDVWVPPWRPIIKVSKNRKYKVCELIKV